MSPKEDLGICGDDLWEYFLQMLAVHVFFLKDRYVSMDVFHGRGVVEMVKNFFHQQYGNDFFRDLMSKHSSVLKESHLIFGNFFI